MNRHSLTVLLGAALAAGWSFQSRAEVKEHPYQIIIVRNAFGLRPIPPPPPPPENTPPPPPPPLGIAMTGITTLLGKPKVFLELTDPQTKKVERPSALLEGDSYKGVSVVSIDPENNRVKIKNGDAELWLDFDKNGLKPGGGAPAPVPHPGFPGIKPATAGVPVPGGAAAFGDTTARGGLVGGGYTAPAAAPGVAPGYNPGAVASVPGLPQRPLRTDGGAGLVGGVGTAPAAAPVAPAAPTMTPAQAQAMIEARRMQLQQQGSPAAAILPPTALGRELQGSGVPGVPGLPR